MNLNILLFSYPQVLPSVPTDPEAPQYLYSVFVELVKKRSDSKREPEALPLKGRWAERRWCSKTYLGDGARQQRRR